MVTHAHPQRRTDHMTFPGDQEPPRHVWYSLEEALELLAVLEDAADALTDSGHLRGHGRGGPGAGPQP